MFLHHPVVNMRNLLCKRETINPFLMFSVFALTPPTTYIGSKCLQWAYLASPMWKEGEGRVTLFTGYFDLKSLICGSGMYVRTVVEDQLGQANIIPPGCFILERSDIKLNIV